MNFTIFDIRIHNFISFKDQYVDLYDKGLVWIRGDNKDEPQKGGNATGKTLFGDAALWLFTGNTSRSILADSVIGSFDKWASVSSKVKAGHSTFQITRYRKHPTFGNSIQIQSEKESGRANKRKIDDVEEQLEEIIGCSLPLFRLSCFQYGDPQYHFSRMHSSQRAKILDEIIGASEEDIPRRYKLINKSLSDFNTELVELQSEKTHVSRHIEDLQAQIKNNNDVISNAEKLLKKELDRKREEIGEIVVLDLDEVRERQRKLELLYRRTVDANAKVDALNRKRDEVDSEYRKYQQECSVTAHLINQAQPDIKIEKGARCRVCGNVATKESLQALVNEARQKTEGYIGQLDQAKEKESALVGKLKEIDAAIKKHTPIVAIGELGFRIKVESGKLQEAAKVKEKIRSLQNELTEYESQHRENIQSVIKRTANYEQQIQGERKTVKKNILKIWQLQHRIESLEVLSSFYSPSGFRPLVMEHYAPILSECANYFFKDFTEDAGDILVSNKSTLGGGKVVDKIDIRVSESGKIKPFPAAWSQSEGGCIDFSLNCAVMRLASTKAAKEFSLLWLDEIASFLHAKWIGKLFDIIQNKLLGSGKTVLITSNQKLDESLFQNVWTVVKQNGESRILINSKENK